MKRKLIIGLIALAVITAACTRGGDDAGATRAVEGAPSDTFSAPVTTVAATMFAAAPEQAYEDRAILTSQSDVLPPGVQVIRDASVELRVDEGSFAAKWSQLNTLASDFGGYIADASTGVADDGDKRYAFGTATVRVPAESFDAFIARVGNLGEQIHLSMTSQDVSQQYVDLKSRLRHWQATESFLLGLMEKATTIDEALRLQNQLDNVQLNVEQIQGQLNYLDSRTDFSAVTVTLTEAPDTIVPVDDDEPSELAQALDQARQVIMAIFSFLIVAAAATVPVALLALVAFGVFRIVRRFTRSKAPVAG